MSGNLKKLVCILSSITIGIGVFLPFLGVNVLGNFVSLPLIKASDLACLIFLAAIISLVNSIYNFSKAPAICGAVSLIITVILSYSTTEKIAENAGLSSDLTNVILQKGPGFYCVIIASIILIVFSFIPVNDT